MPLRPRAPFSLALSLALAAGCAPAAQAQAAPTTPAPAPAINPWMAPAIITEQATATDDTAKEQVAHRRADLLLAAMSLPQKMQQLAGSPPEILPELPQCFGARHVSGIAALNIPTFRIANGPVGVGQNDCISRKVYDEVVAGNPSSTAGYVAYTHPTSAQATALPSGMAVAASFEPGVAADFGHVIATELNALGLHVFEAPGVNLARLPILGRNFEYFGEDPFLTGTMAAAEIRAVQSRGLIAMVKHFVANEQETNRQAIQETVPEQALRELYLIPFEMAVKDGKAAAVMCAYNSVNGYSSCENPTTLTQVLRHDWGFTGYVQSDFFAMKSTVATLAAGMDHEMPLPSLWSPAKLNAALAKGDVSVGQIDRALERRYTQMFKAGIFDRPLTQSPIDFAADGRKAREIGARSAVLLQNNGALPLPTNLRSLVILGKASQIYAQQAVAGGAITGKPMGSGGGSSDVVPHYSVTPLEGIRAALREAGNESAPVKLILVDDSNASATIDGAKVPFAQALTEAARAEAVVIMAGTVAEEGADRATFVNANGKQLAESTSASAGSSLDWYAPRSNLIATHGSGENQAADSQTVALIKAVLATHSTTGKAMAAKTALVLKDNAGIAVDPALVGRSGPAMLEAWFPGQEDGNIVADLLFGRVNPSGHLPVTLPYAGKGFLDSISPAQFPGQPDPKTGKQTVTYAEGLRIGYRWYDGNAGGHCATMAGRNPCVAFPFGHGLSYTRFAIAKPSLQAADKPGTYRASVRVTNIGKRSGAEVVQVYVSPPAQASALGLPQPPRRLAGFGKVELKPGETREVSVLLDTGASNHPFGVWDSAKQGWTIPAGPFRVWLGRSSALKDMQLAGMVTPAAK